MALRELKKILLKIVGKRQSLSASRNLHHIMWERAVVESANFVEDFKNVAMIFETKEQMWNYVCEQVRNTHTRGIILEFGVFQGVSINYLAHRLKAFQFYGFDSFIGLKEDWIGHHLTKGAFSRGGKLPKVSDNVVLYKGWFDETLPDFVRTHSNDLSDVRLIHFDGDTYEAAVTIFENLNAYMRAGVLILFDELLGYPNWENGEWKALKEAADKYGFQYEFVAFTTEQALIRIL